MRGIAKEIHANSETVRYWLQGIRGVPVDRVAALATAMGISRDALVEATGTVEWCASHKKPMPCVSCVLNAESNRAVWRDPVRRQKRIDELLRRKNAWLDEETQVLYDYAGKLPVQALVDKVNAIRQEHNLPGRTVSAVLKRIEERGLSALRNPDILSMPEVKQLFGAPKYHKVGLWHRQGLLVGMRWTYYDVFTMAELESLIREKPWLLDVDKMPSGRLKMLAEAVVRRNPYIRVRELAKQISVPARRIRELCRRGDVPYEKRPGPDGAYMIRASDVDIVLAIWANRHTVEEKKAA